MNYRYDEFEKIGNRELYFKKVDSTQDTALRYAREGCGHGFVIHADLQTNARGRNMKKWIAPSGGLWMSVVLRPPFAFSRFLRGLSVRIGLAIVIALQKEYAILIKTKWPNDLFVDDRKLGGIIIETTLDKKPYVIVGLGINVNNATNLLSKKLNCPTISLSEILGFKLSKTKVRTIIYHALDLTCREAIRGTAIDAARVWKNKSASTHKKVKAILEDETVTGIEVGISPKGALKVKTPTGKIREIDHGSLHIV